MVVVWEWWGGSKNVSCFQGDLPRNNVVCILGSSRKNEIKKNDTVAQAQPQRTLVSEHFNVPMGRVKYHLGTFDRITVGSYLISLQAWHWNAVKFNGQLFDFFVIGLAGFLGEAMVGGSPPFFWASAGMQQHKRRATNGGYFILLFFISILILCAEFKVTTRRST